MPSYTAQQIVNAALENLGILEQGGTPSASDGASGLLRLNMMIEQWQIQNKLVWQITNASYSLTANVGQYLIGNAQTFNAQRPNYIESAQILLQGPNAANPVSHPLRLIGSVEYSQIHDFSARSDIPDRLYNDRGSPFSLLVFYPYPRVRVATQVQLFTWAMLQLFATLGTSADLPEGYAEAMSNALSIRCAPMFGAAIAPEVLTVCAQLATQAEAAIVALNDKARGMMSTPQQAAA